MKGNIMLLVLSALTGCSAGVVIRDHDRTVSAGAKWHQQGCAVWVDEAFHGAVTYESVHCTVSVSRLGE